MDPGNIIFAAASNIGSASIELDVDKLLKHIKNIFQVEVGGDSAQDASPDCDEKKTTKMIPGLGKLIHEISDEIWCDCKEKRNAQQKAQSLLNLLSKYSPDEKVVLVLAAVAVRYGHVMVIMKQQTNGQLVGSNNMVDSLVSLKELMMGTLPGESTLKPIKHTVEIVLCVAQIIMKLKGFHTWKEIINESHIDETIFWMVTAVIHCGFTVSEFYSGYSSTLNEVSAVDTQKKIQQYCEELTRHFDFYRRREERRQYQKLSDKIENPQASKIDILRYFINTEGNILYKPGTTEQTPLLSFQEDNHVLILYSSFAIDTFQYELSLLNPFYNKTKTKIVWVPIDLKPTIKEDSYKEIISKISCCYTLTFQAVMKVNCGLVHLLQKDWGFTGKPMLVVLDERGRVVRKNALLMLDLFGDDEFPFTTVHENQLLATKYRGMQLLFPDTDASTLSEWIKSKEQYVCLYGGPNIEWCEDMGSKLEAFVEGAKIKVMTAYVGRNSHHKKKVEETLASFIKADLGYYMEYSKSTVFWERVEKFMCHFSTHDSSNVSKGFLSWASPLLTLDKSRVSWVAIGNADNVQVFTGSVFLSGLDLIFREFNEWRSEFTTDNFHGQLKVWMDKSKAKQEKQNHCHKLEIAGSPALIRGDMHCPTCNERMQMMMLYKCCTTGNSI